MKYCPKNAARRQQARETNPAPAAVQSASEPPVRRYVHPIRTVQGPRREPLEEVLADVLDILGRQTQLLEELLRRTDGSQQDGGKG